MMVKSIATQGEHARGDPDVPEERNPKGHDSRPDPSPLLPPVAAGTKSAPISSQADISNRQPSKVDDAKFLADEFDIPERKAVAAVAGERTEEEVTAITADLHARLAADDHLAGVPVPRRDETDFADAEETPAKPVIHRTNQRTGAG